MGRLIPHPLALLPLAFPLLISCSSPSSQCIEERGANCSPLYQPTYQNIFERTLVPKCGVGDGVCHGGSSVQAGLRLDDAEAAYRGLVDEGRVIPEDPACSLMSVRLGGGGGGAMPPGAPLSAAERCSIETWIREGALR